MPSNTLLHSALPTSRPTPADAARIASRSHRLQAMPGGLRLVVSTGAAAAAANLGLLAYADDAAPVLTAPGGLAFGLIACAALLSALGARRNAAIRGR